MVERTEVDGDTGKRKAERTKPADRHIAAAAGDTGIAGMSTWLTSALRERNGSKGGDGPNRNELVWATAG